MHACVRSLVCVHACPWVVGGRAAAGLAIHAGIYIHRSLNIPLLCVYMYICMCMSLHTGGWMDGWMDGWMRMHGCVGLYAIYIIVYVDVYMYRDR